MKIEDYKLDKILINLGFSPKLKGFFFIKETYKLAINKQNLTSLNFIFKQICEENGFVFKPASIDRAIRYCIEDAFDKNEEFKKNYNKKPTVKNFIFDLICNKNNILNL